MRLYSHVTRTIYAEIFHSVHAQLNLILLQTERYENRYPMLWNLVIYCDVRCRISNVYNTTYCGNIRMGEKSEQNLIMLSWSVFYVI